MLTVIVTLLFETRKVSSFQTSSEKNAGSEKLDSESRITQFLLKFESETDYTGFWSSVLHRMSQAHPFFEDVMRKTHMLFGVEEPGFVFQKSSVTEMGKLQELVLVQRIVVAQQVFVH